MKSGPPNHLGYTGLGLPREDGLKEARETLRRNLARLDAELEGREDAQAMTVLKRKGKFFLAEEKLNPDNLSHTFIAGGKKVDPRPKVWFVGEQYNYMRFYDLGQAEKYFEQISNT